MMSKSTKRYIGVLLIAIILFSVCLGARWLLASTPKHKTHYFPAGLASQTATTAVEAYMQEGFVTHDQIRNLHVHNNGQFTGSPAYKTFQGTTYEKVFEFGTRYDYKAGFFSPVEKDNIWFLLVAHDSQRNKWVVYGGGTGP